MNTPVLFVCLFPHSSASQNTEQSQFQFSSVQFSHSVVSDSLRPHELQHARPPCPSPTLGVYSNSCPSSRWHHPAISSSVVPFSSCPQSLPASGSFPMSQLFAWGSQSIGVSASASGSHKSKFACARLLTGGSGEETTCKLIQVVGQIQILVVIGLGLSFLFFFLISVRDHSQLLKVDHILCKCLPPSASQWWHIEYFFCFMHLWLPLLPPSGENSMLLRDHVYNPG